MFGRNSAAAPATPRLRGDSVADEAKPPTPPPELPPEVVADALQAYEDRKFRRRLLGMIARGFKATAAFILTTSATIVVLGNAWEGVKRWLGSLAK